ncbi:sigma-70 family RNA polymerase sigma factor [uncultured Maribacter sp.]|uniref:RNA polymerase sigma factor n=1 Tax=uncultured Maribacter sp. TaxID=431308 RepID=UPI002633E865|nr:sigma-70 family RNA polymerase sigma factor [uncultured Maribacter sp.]
MKDKNSQILEKVFVEHYDEWCLLSYSYLQDMDEAEEIVQDVCVSILLKGRLKRILNPKAYIAISVKNKSLQRIKELNKYEVFDTQKLHVVFSAEENLIQKEKKQFLEKAIASLPDASKKVFSLCVLEGEKYQKVAKTLGISINTVKYHLKKAYKILRVEVKDAYYSLLIIVEFIFF